jgi:hypothetical protein
MRRATEAELAAFYAGVKAAGEEAAIRLQKAISNLSKMELADAADLRKGLNQAVAVLEVLPRMDFEDWWIDEKIKAAIQERQLKGSAE